MNEYSENIENAKLEAKRSDHLVFVSLKYTRTVDVIRSVINRLIDAYNAIIDGMLEKLESSNLIHEIPVAPMVKVNLIKEKYINSELHDHFDFYLHLRRLYRAKYTARDEFRKGVTMTADLEGEGKVEVNIESVMQFYGKAKEFIEFIKKLEDNDE